jgi:RNA polymerase sigma-70 factor (ECF subfamily)
MVVIPFRPQRNAVTRQGFDAAYIERLGNEDPQTVQHFCAYFGQLIHIKARARRVSSTLAEDVRQETFLRVLRTLKSPGGLRTAECLGAFVNSVCNNVLLERFRDQKRHEPPSEEPAPLPDTETPSPEAQLITREGKEAVRRVLDAMTPQNRRLLCAILLEEGDREDVCREFGVTPDYLRVLLHRAKKEFRALFSGAEPNGRGPGQRESSDAGAGGGTGTRAGGFGRPARKALGL